MNLFFRKHGEGPPIIILHGLYGMADNWFTVSRMLGRYFEVYTVDLRNHGRSGHDVEHNYDVMSADLVEFMDTNFLSTATIMGHSMGGKLAMNFALLYPQRVANLIVVDIAPVSYVGLDVGRVHGMSHGDIWDAMSCVDLSVFSDRDSLDRRLAEQISDGVLRRFLLKNIARDGLGRFRWMLNVEGLRANLHFVLDNIPMADCADVCGCVFPVLFLRGSVSDYISEAGLVSIARLFPSYELVCVEGAGHWLHVERPDFLVRMVVDFVF